MSDGKKRVLSGMRPTGRLHIGHYFGALANWVRLENDPSFDCFYFVADWHALTSDYADASAVAQNTIEIVTDYLAAGLHPAKSVIFQQSLVPEHAELHLLLSMVTPLSWLERVPTYKEQIENVTNKDLHTYGFLGYPCLQTADIVIYSKSGAPLFVPVGEDQVSHVELSREIVRRFNLYYGLSVHPDLFSPQNRKVVRGQLRNLLDIPGTTSVFPEADLLSPEQKMMASSYIRQRVYEMGIGNFFEGLPAALKPFFSFSSVLEEPQVMLTETPRIPGTDGRKMSKSYGNAISLSESDAEIYAKTKVMVTDPARKRRSDPGNPDVCPVGDWHKLFSKDEPGRMEWVYQGCTTAGIGCIECKKAMADNLVKWIAPVRERRLEYEQHPKRVLEVIDEGSKKARVEAKGTIERVREAVFGWERKRKEVAAT